MKTLTRMLLVNWHYYSLELIAFDQINFLTGKTGSGKSTIIDALQIVLLGDTKGERFFNKAANDRSRRSLKGYLRGEYGDDGDAGFLYLRTGPFTSYLVCEIFDTEKNRFFSVGAAFDCNYTPVDECQFFILKDKIPDHAFLSDDIPMEIKNLKHFLKANYDRSHYDLCTTAREYQDKLLGHLGSLNRRYFTIFKKAVSFTPITDIETFITENICDAKKPPDLSGMQDNLRQYRKLEQEARMMQGRIADLEGIHDVFEKLADEKQRLILYEFLISRSDKESLQSQYDKAQIELRDLKASLKIEEESCDAERRRQEGIQEEITHLIEERGQSDIYQRQQRLTDEKNSLNLEIEEHMAGLKKLVGRLNQYGLQWRIAAEEADNLTLELERSGSIPSLEGELRAMKDVSDPFRQTAESLLDIRESMLERLNQDTYVSFQKAYELFQKNRILLQRGIENLLARTEEELEDCRARIEDLRKDIKPYDQKLLWFRDELEKHLSQYMRRNVQVDILADLLEIRSARWANVIEGYLKKQKEYLLVEPAAYEEAMRHYDHLRREKKLYEISLIDGERVQKRGFPTRPGSLAEEIETDNPYVRAYINFLMGNVMKCDRVTDLRKYEKAVTDQGVLYQGYVTGSIHPSLWDVHLIGKKSIEQQLRKQEELEPELKKKAAVMRGFHDKAAKLRSIEAMNQNETADHFACLERAKEIPVLQEKAREIATQLSSLDLSWIERISQQIREKETERKENDRRIQGHMENIGRLREKQSDQETARIPELTEALNHAREKCASFPKDISEGSGELRFQSELASKKSPDKVAQDYRSQIGMRSNAIKNFEEQLTNARSSYNQKYNYTYNVADTGNEKYDKQLQILKQEELPRYTEKIDTAKKMAYEQFANQFLAEMKANIEEVYARISELNNALKHSAWGTERFSFQIRENPDYRRFYDMITDPMLMEGYTLMAQPFQDKHGAAISELFARIADYGPDMDADARTQMEKNIKIFTDYKTYLRFDMISTDENDNKQRLSRTLLKKSGGETQTPFYIAILASFAQLYHIRDKKWNSFRLIIFDEAFSKMDGERIRESIQLLKKIGFQCILSAPPEKIGDIVPLVDRNIVAIRNGQSSSTHAFDARHPVFQALMEDSSLDE